MAVVALGWFVVIGTSIWVAIDAASIGARKGLVKGFFDMGVAGWFFACLLLWIIGFPGYLATRDKIKAAAVGGPGGYQMYGGQWVPQWQPQWQAPPHPVRPELSTAGWTIPAPPPAVRPQPVTPGPEWYVDPENPSLLRWWDGTQWTEHRKHGGLA